MNVLARDEYRYLFSLPAQAQPSSWFTAFRAALLGIPTCACCRDQGSDAEAYLKTAGALNGLSNINTLALPFLLKDTYHLSPAGLGLMGALIAAPVFLKPVFALLQGSGKPKKPFLVLAACGDFAARVGVGLLPTDGSQLAAMGSLLILGSTSIALDTITRDTLLIESTGRRQEQEPNSVASDGLIADVAGLASVTALSVAYFSGYLLQFTTPAHLILGSAAIPAMALLNAVRLVETDPTVPVASFPEESEVCLEEKAQVMWHMLRGSPVLISQLGASSISALAPTFQDALFYFYIDELHLTPEFFGRWRLVGNVASLLSNGLYRAAFKDTDQNSLAMVTQALMLPVICSAWFITTGTTEKFFFGMSPATFILVRHAIFDGLETLAAIPNTVMLARMAPRGKEGIFFAVYGLINDATSVINSTVSSGTTLAFGIHNGNFDNMNNLVLFSSALQLLVAPWSLWTPETFPVAAPAPEEVHEAGLPTDGPVRDPPVTSLQVASSSIQ